MGAVGELQVLFTLLFIYVCSCPLNPNSFKSSVPGERCMAVFTATAFQNHTYLSEHLIKWHDFQEPIQHSNFVPAWFHEKWSLIHTGTTLKKKLSKFSAKASKYWVCCSTNYCWFVLILAHNFAYYCPVTCSLGDGRMCPKELASLLGKSTLKRHILTMFEATVALTAAPSTGLAFVLTGN